MADWVDRDTDASSLGNTEAAIDFLKRWAPIGYWSLTAIDPTKGVIETKTFGADTEREAATWINFWQGKRNLYFSVNQPRTALTTKAQKRDIGSLVALHVDIDPCDPPKDEEDAELITKHYAYEQEQILARLKAYQPAPSVIVYSGGGYQGFWLFREPVGIEGPVNVVSLELYNKKLEADLGGDHCFNIDRIMRLPGTINLPNKKKQAKGRKQALAAIASADWKLLYSIHDFKQQTPSNETKPEGKASGHIAGPRRAPPEWCAQLIAHGPDPKGDRFYDGDRSKAVWAVCGALVRCGYSDAEIAETILDPANRISEHVREQPRSRVYAERQATRAREAVASDTDPNEVNLPVVRIKAGELPRMVDEAEAALIATADDLYRQGNRIIRPLWDEINTSAGKAPTLRISEVQAAHLHERFTKAAYFERSRKKKDGEWESSRADCPSRVVDAYMARDGDWRLRALLGVVTAPTLRSDGTVLDKPGYDAASGLVFNPCGVTFLPVRENPTKDDAHRALAILMEPIKDFPFVTEQDKAVALSGIITAVIRRALPVAPIHAFSAPTAGTGKSLLVDVASVIATGERAATTSMGRNKYGDAELEKRLVSSYLAGDPIVTIDNIEGPLGGDFLCQISSQHQVKLRPLGRSINVMVPNTLALYANGNNLVIVGDLTRRVLRADLDAKVERPELREFNFDPVEYAQVHRAELVAAALTIVRAWLVSGEFAPDKPLGGYREWSALVRDPLIWLGVADPVGTMEKTRRNDPRLDKLRTVISAWRAVFVDREVTVREMTEAFGRVLPSDEQDPDTGRAHAYPDLRAALLSVAANGRGEVRAETLSWWLRKNEGRPIRLAEGEPSHRIVKGEDAKRDRWKVETLREGLFAQVGQ